MTKTEFIKAMLKAGCSKQEAVALWEHGFRTVRPALFNLRLEAIDNGDSVRLEYLDQMLSAIDVLLGAKP